VKLSMVVVPVSPQFVADGCQLFPCWETPHAIASRVQVRLFQQVAHDLLHPVPIATGHDATFPVDQKQLVRLG
jgi:hypothetical protein